MTSPIGRASNGTRDEWIILLISRTDVWVKECSGAESVCHPFRLHDFFIRSQKTPNQNVSRGEGRSKLGYLDLYIVTSFMLELRS